MPQISPYDPDSKLTNRVFEIKEPPTIEVGKEEDYVDLTRTNIDEIT